MTPHRRDRDVLLWTWHFDKERPSKDEVLRHCLEHTVAELKSQLPTYWQIHEPSPAKIPTSASVKSRLDGQALDYSSERSLMSCAPTW
jgi:hypothetical protein